MSPATARSASWVRRVLRALRELLAPVVGLPSSAGPLPWTPRSRRARRLLSAAVGGYGLVVAIAASSALDDQGRLAGGLAFLWVLPMVLALVLTLRRPLDGWRLTTLWLVLTPFLVPGTPVPGPLLETWEWCLWVPVLLAVGWALPRRVAAGVGLASGIVLVLLTFGTPWVVQGGRMEVSVLAVAAVLLLGMSLGARWDAGRALAQEQARTETALAARGALAERARIAREMHDVVAHELSAIAVRAETAPYRVPSLPAEAQHELAEMADTARRALTELQQLLGVLRADDQQADRAPQPGLRTLPDLVAAAEAYGVRVTADVADVDLPVPLQLTLFRIVQQSLTNAHQHAPGSAVQLTVRLRGGQLLVEVVNGPGTGPGSPGAGVGLLGMRERAELHGGSLTAGPTPDGGFAVRTRLPLDGEPVDAAAAPVGSGGRPVHRARRTT